MNRFEIGPVSGVWLDAGGLRRMAGRCCALCGLLLALIHSPSAGAATLPAGFIETTVTPRAGGWNEAVGLTFDHTARMYVWERPGRVWIREHEGTTWSQLIDIRQEVGAWDDHGLLGFALDPNFSQNGYIYLMYVVDRHHLMHFGTGNYNSSSNTYSSATIGRITRYTANAADGFKTVDLATRKVLLGETRQTGIPILYTSHGVGSLVFGTDGTLLATCGDGASWTTVDTGSLATSYFAQALTDGIIRTNENVGAYRSQMVNSHNGKVLRLDPATGDGVPGNPFYDPANPRSPASRVWALGLRNPFRATLRPETGSHNREDGNPGVLYIGDVGNFTWEDMNVVTGAGQNFGWPAFEGLDVQFSYYSVNTQNRDVPNPFFGVGGCTQQYLFFNQLIKQESLNPVSFTDSCGNTLPGSVRKFVHTRPVLDWQHGVAVTRTGTFNGSGSATATGIGPGSPVSGTPFPGASSTGGTWYNGNDFPAMYKNTYFHGDFVEGWIRNFVFTTNDRPTAVRTFLSGGGGIVAIATHPVDGGLYYISYASTLRRIDYAPGGNFPPTAVIKTDKHFGPGPLTVQFTGTNSVDPEGLPLGFTWNFGDGSPTNGQPNPAHTFTAAPGVPAKYTVTLTVRDNSGATNASTTIISVNNTPPSVAITSPVDGTRYPLTSETIYNLTASVTDAEFPDSQLRYDWVTYLHHNTHHHSGPSDTNHATTTVISPAGCDGNIYYYRISLRVTDPAGLSTEKEVFLYPDCPGLAVPVITWPPVSPITYGTALGEAQFNALADVPGVFTYSLPAGTVPDAGSNRPLTLLFAPADALNYSLVTASNSVTVLQSPLTVTADDKSMVYGDPIPELTAIFEGFVNGDSPVSLDTPVILETTPASAAVVSNHLITATGASAANYDVTHVNGTLTVTPAALNVTAHSTNRLFGEPNPPLTGTVEGLRNEDDITPGFATDANSASPVGEYLVSPILIDPSGKLPNYTITTNHGTLVIGRAPLTVVADDKTRAYGDINPELTSSYAGFVNDDDTNVLSGTPVLNTVADTNSPVDGSPYAIAVSQGSLSADNYEFTFVDGTLTVTQALLTITADNKTNLHGAPLPGLTATYLGFVNGDGPDSLDFPVLLHTTATSESPAGDYPIAAEGAMDANYSITHVGGVMTIRVFELEWVGWGEEGEPILRPVGVEGIPFSIRTSGDLLTWETAVHAQNPDGTITIEKSSDPHRYYKGVAPPQP